MFKIVKVLIWIAIVIFVSLGVVASINQMPPDPNSYNPGFVKHPIMTWLHAIPGLLFMVLGPFQFIPSIRRKYPLYHKISGRIILVSCLLLGISALMIVFTFPYTRINENLSDLSEQIPNTFFALLFLIFAFLGYYYIRKKNITKHRKYMIRVFAIGLGISLFRIIIIVTAIMGMNPLLYFGVFFWLGFSITWACAEVYIKVRRV
tara:strand:- start:101920 stop:102534 length:615 start_codon:yes stop_codon:yes gene_type:complete